MLISQKEHHDHFTLALLSGLGAIEFFVSAIMILSIDSDPKNAFLFGFSSLRIGIFLVALSTGLLMLYLAVRIFRQGIALRAFSFFTGEANWFTLVVLIFLLDLAVLIAPSALMGTFHGYFERLRPLLVAIGLQPIQFSMPWLVKRLEKLDKKITGLSLAAIILVALVWVFIRNSKLGITPDQFYWNVAGMPLTALQFLVILFAGMLGLGLVSVFARRFQKDIPGWKHFLSVDILLALLLFLVAAVTWSQAPMLKHYFSVEPLAPYYQPYPYSDARIYDLGAISILRGYGIYYGHFIDKPLYLVFLAFLHRLAGFDYNLLTRLQAIILAGMIPALYWFGKTFHSRFLGVIIALITIVRQTNALFLSNNVASANPRLLLSEIPTMFGLVLLTWLLFAWLVWGRSRPWIVFLSGGLLGALSLIRLNPLALLPVIPLFSLCVFWGRKRAWLKHSFAFLLGFSILVIPWVLTGLDETGKPYWVAKFENVITVRYDPSPSPPQNNLFLIPAGTPPKSGGSSSGEAVSSASGLAAGGDVQKFPNFILNHTLHNFVGAFLALPDSFSQADQDLITLTERPYWQDVLVQKWLGSLTPGQIPTLVLSLALFAIGLAWSWKRWRWAGWVPGVVFIVYCVSLGFARNSGSRYIVPVDWIVFFYTCVGLLALAEVLPVAFRQFVHAAPLAFDPKKQISHSLYFEKRMTLGSVALVFVLASLVLVAQAPVLANYGKYPAGQSTCQAEFVFPPGGPQAMPGNRFVVGEILYPRLKDARTFTFSFNSCGLIAEMAIQASPVGLYHTQPVIAEISDSIPHTLEALYWLDENSVPQLLWRGLKSPG